MAHRRTPLVLDPPGRFTPAQIIALVIAMAMALALVPVGAKAAGSLVTLADSKTTRLARVDSTSSLTVASRPANSKSWYYRVLPPSGADQPLFVPPTGTTTLGLTSLTYASSADTPAASELKVYGSASCASSFIGSLETMIIPASDTRLISFAFPVLIAPGGSNWCLVVHADFAGGFAVTATGYYY